MLRLITLLAATLATFYYVLVTFGETDASSRSEATAAASDATPAAERFELASFMPQPGASGIDVQPLSSEPEGPSAAEAVQIAIQAGKDLRAARARGTELDTLALDATASRDVASATSAAAPSIGGQTRLWYVSGNTVNLRAGPSTRNEVIGRVTLGDAAETLSDTAAAWVEIRTETGQRGWISGQFLSPEAPGSG